MKWTRELQRNIHIGYTNMILASAGNYSTHDAMAYENEQAISLSSIWNGIKDFFAGLLRTADEVDMEYYPYINRVSHSHGEMAQDLKVEAILAGSLFML